MHMLNFIEKNYERKVIMWGKYAVPCVWCSIFHSLAALSVVFPHPNSSCCWSWIWDRTEGNGKSLCGFWGFVLKVYNDGHNSKLPANQRKPKSSGVLHSSCAQYMCCEADALARLLCFSSGNTFGRATLPCVRHLLLSSLGGKQLQCEELVIDHWAASCWACVPPWAVPREGEQRRALSSQKISQCFCLPSAFSWLALGSWEQLGISFSVQVYFITRF